MNCTISDSADLKMRDILAQEEDKDLVFRVFVAHVHGDHAHYGLGLDYPKDTNERVMTDVGIVVLFERGQSFLDGVTVDYTPETDTWMLSHPAAPSDH